MKRHKTKHWWDTWANLKNHNFNIIRVPLLLFYMVTVAQSAEITVKCRSISSNFTDPNAVSLFVFFELEVFAFAGLLVGLWVWLTLKYFLSSMYAEGPQHVFKTRGVKHAND